MAVEERDSVENTQLGSTDEEGSATETNTEEDDDNKPFEWDDSEDVGRHSAPKIVNSTVTSGATLGAVGVTAETARRIGIDRYAEAGFAERAYAEAYAQKVGGTVVDNGASVFTPDGGIDKIVETPSGKIRIQSKHYGRTVGDHVLQKTAGKVDVIGATNGVSESVDPEAYSVDVVTSDDWLWRTKAKLQTKRVIRGFGKGITTIKHGIQAVTSRLVDAAKFSARCAVISGKWLYRRLSKFGSIAAKWFSRRSLTTQLALIVTVVGLVYLVWDRYNEKNEEEDCTNKKRTQTDSISVD